jgi:hypothetical protein
MTLAREFLVASGHTGETAETFVFPADATYPTPIERVVCAAAVLHRGERGVPFQRVAVFGWSEQI